MPNKRGSIFLRESYFRGVKCTKCGKEYPGDTPHNMSSCCNSILLAQYDLDKLASARKKQDFNRRKAGVWQFHELLPVKNHHNIIMLGEGGTPLIPLAKLAKELSLKELFLKEEGLNPTGTFKARGSSVGVSTLLELGLKKLTLPTSGNAGIAWAAYCARAGIDLHLAMPRSTSIETQKECRLYGANIELVDGTIFEAELASAEACKREGRFDVTHFREPYRVEGKKTIAFEIAMQCEWNPPDVVIYPTGGGIGPVGFWKGISELLELEWIKHPVRIIIVQANGCAPLVKAYNDNKVESEYWNNADTIAKGLCTPKTHSDSLILQIVRDTGGSAISVSDIEIIEMLKKCGRLEGIFGCPEGMASLAAIPKLLMRGTIDPDERVLIVNTGTGLKYHKYI